MTPNPHPPTLLLVGRKMDDDDDDEGRGLMRCTNSEGECRVHMMMTAELKVVI